jgi:hypothetical protein
VEELVPLQRSCVSSFKRSSLLIAMSRRWPGASCVGVAGVHKCGKLVTMVADSFCKMYQRPSTHLPRATGVSLVLQYHDATHHTHPRCCKDRCGGYRPAHA